MNNLDEEQGIDGNWRVWTEKAASPTYSNFLRVCLADRIVSIMVLEPRVWRIGRRSIYLLLLSQIILPIRLLIS